MEGPIERSRPEPGLRVAYVTTQLWHPIQPATRPVRVDVFSGTADGWAASQQCPVRMVEPEPDRDHTKLLDQLCIGIRWASRTVGAQTHSTAGPAARKEQGAGQRPACGRRPRGCSGSRTERHGRTDIPGHATPRGRQPADIGDRSGGNTVRVRRSAASAMPLGSACVVAARAGHPDCCGSPRRSNASGREFVVVGDGLRLAEVLGVGLVHRRRHDVVLATGYEQRRQTTARDATRHPHGIPGAGSGATVSSSTGWSRGGERTVCRPDSPTAEGAGRRRGRCDCVRRRR